MATSEFQIHICIVLLVDQNCSYRSRWKFADIFSVSGDTHNKSLEAAIFDFSTSGLVAQYSHESQWNSGPQKRRFSHWNFSDILSVILSGSSDTCI